MAKLLNPFSLAFSGKLGDKVGVKGRYGYYVRSVGQVKVPPTEKQLASRMKMSLAISFMNPIKDLLQMVYLNPKKERMSACNRAVGDMVKYAIAGGYPDLYIDFSKVEVSSGRLWGACRLTLSVAPDWTIGLSWDLSYYGQYAAPDDKVIVLLYDPDSRLFHLENKDARRSDASLEFKPPIVPVSCMHGWLIFYSEALKTASSSLYLGCLEPGLDF